MASPRPEAWNATARSAIAATQTQIKAQAENPWAIESLQKDLLGGTIGFATIVLLLYGARMYCRNFPMTKMWWDDMYLSLAAVSLSSIHR